MASTEDRNFRSTSNTQASLKRRQVLTGVAAGAGVGLMLQGSAVQAHDLPYIANVKQYGAVGNGTNDDTSAVQGAINSGLPVYFPPGEYKLTSAVGIWPPAPARDLVMFGDGPDVSRLRFDSATDGIGFTSGQHHSYHVDQLIVRDLGLVSGNAGNLNAIYAYWTWGSVGRAALPSAYIENVSVTQANDNCRFITGFCLVGGDNSRIVNCHLTQFKYAPPYTRDAYGVILDSVNSSTNAPETTIIGCQFINHGTGVWLRGFVEGTKIVDCSFVGSVTGVLSDGTGLPDGLGGTFIDTCHFDTYSIGILAKNSFNVQVQNNYFIAENGSTNPGFCVKLERSQGAVNIAMSDDVLIAHNIFRRNDNSGSGIYAVHAEGTPTYKVTNVLIDANRYCGGAKFTNTAVLGSNSARVLYTDTNVTDGGHGAPVNSAGASNVVNLPNPAVS